MGHFTYLGSELLWALPVLLVQWIIGHADLWSHRRALLLGILVPTTYLSCADSVAIANRIWFFHAGQIVGLRVGNVPVEEIIFFGMTNAMVVQSVILVAAWRNRRAVVSSEPSTTGKVVQTSDKPWT